MSPLERRTSVRRSNSMNECHVLFEESSSSYQEEAKTARISEIRSNLSQSCLESQERLTEKPWKCGDPYVHGTPKSKNSWQECHRLVDKYDKEMCDAWKDEVDKLLIFAGLFSATVTAFTIESYKWLQEGPEDVSARLLGSIYLQLQNSTVANPSTPLVSLISQPFTVTSSDVRINIMWFLSLTLSLSTVSIGILCLQWIREYQRDAALPHKDAIALRQMRYDGLIQWNVPAILSALPLIIQTSLVFFFIGLLDLLWGLNKLVASFITAAAGIAMLFLLVTTVLPGFQHALSKNLHLRILQCPYKSPQSWLFLRLVFWLFTSFTRLFKFHKSTYDSTRFYRLLKSASDSNWVSYDMRWRRFRDASEVSWGTPKDLKDSDDIVRGLKWINSIFTQSVDAIYPTHQSMMDLEIPVAFAAVSELYREGQIDDATFRVMMDDRFSPHLAQKRDIITAFFLQTHQDTHPILKASYVESVLRILNSQEVPQPFLDWLSRIIQDCAKSPSSTNFMANDRDITTQILFCVKSLLQRNKLQNLDIVMTWILLHRLNLTKTERRYLKLASEILEVFEQWLAKSQAYTLLERVKICVKGMLIVFPSTTDFSALYTECSDMWKAVSLIQALDTYLMRLGGASAMLESDESADNYLGIFDEDKWFELLHHFDFAPEKGGSSEG